jgi:hypothetical protein
MQQVEKMPLFSLLLIACFRFEDFFSCRLKLVPLYAESHISPLFAKLDALDPSPASREEIRYGYDLRCIIPTEDEATYSTYTGT